MGSGTLRERVLKLADKLKLDVAPELRNVTITDQAVVATSKGLYPFQIKGVQFLSIGKYRLLGDEMGCVDGEAIININRGSGGFGKGLKIKLKDLHHKFNGGVSGHGKYWDLSIPTRVRALCNGEFHQHEISKVLDKGVKSVLKLTLESGKTLRLTKDHEVCCPGEKGEEWTEVQNLTVGDEVYVNGQPSCKKCGGIENVSTFRGFCKKCIYTSKRGNHFEGKSYIDKDGYVMLRSGEVISHPRYTSWGIPEHIIVMEKKLGRYLVDDEEIHHINRDKQDNRPENLELKNSSTHASLHGREGGFKKLHGAVGGKGGLITFIPAVDIVVSVVPDGEAHVYDIVCIDPYRNFVANGIVVHNCGKTIQALCAIPKGAKTLVVCPNSIKFNWKSECKKWRPDLTAIVLTGKTAFRWPTDNELLIINYDALPERFTWEKDKPAQPTEGDKLSAKEVIFIPDEAHRVSNYKSLRSKRVSTITGLVNQVWALTGTPLLNHPNQLFGMLSSCGMAREVFGSWGKFMQLYNAQKNRWGGIEWGLPSSEVPERLRRVMLRRIRTEVLPDLPRKTYTTMVINGISDSLRKQLDELQEEWGDYIETSNELPPFEDFSRVRAELAEGRIEALLEYVEDCEEQEIPLVVASAHRAPIDCLQKREGWATITGSTPPEERQRVVERFQMGGLKGVGLTIQAGGIGITLTRAWRMLFVDMDWTPSLNSQCEDRLVRIGQSSDKIEIVRMVSDHSLDQHVQSLIASKIQMIESSVEALAKPVIPVLRTQMQGETEEQFKTRMEVVRKAEEDERNQQEVNKKIEIATKVQQMASRYKNKIGRWIEQPITPELDKAIKEAFTAMCNNDPDYAEFRNSVGFNKPDSFIARWLGYNIGNDDELRAMWGCLYKYRRQLEHSFPILWPK